MNNFTLKKWALSLGAYIAFSKIPGSWLNKEQVKLFLQVNQDMIIWLAGLTGIKIDKKFSALYSHVISNTVLFDVFFEYMSMLWINPNKLIDNDSNIDVTPNTDNTKIITRLRDRIKERRAKHGTSVDDIATSASPESLLAVVTVYETLSNLAAIILRINSFDPKRNG